MTDSVTTWLIIAVFYAPLHFLVPVFIAALRANDDARRLAIQRTSFECAASMAVGFALAIWLAPHRLTTAMAVLLVTMAVPYLGMLLPRTEARAKPK